LEESEAGEAERFFGGDFSADFFDFEGPGFSRDFSRLFEGFCFSAGRSEERGFSFSLEVIVTISCSSCSASSPKESLE
jgi:hypothetical protein